MIVFLIVNWYNKPFNKLFFNKGNKFLFLIEFRLNLNFFFSLFEIIMYFNIMQIKIIPYFYKVLPELQIKINSVILTKIKL